MKLIDDKILLVSLKNISLLLYMKEIVIILGNNDRMQYTSNPMEFLYLPNVDWWYTILFQQLFLQMKSDSIILSIFNCLKYSQSFYNYHSDQTCYYIVKFNSFLVEAPLHDFYSLFFGFGCFGSNFKFLYFIFGHNSQSFNNYHADQTF